MIPAGNRRNARVKKGVIAAFVLAITALHYWTGTEHLVLHQIYQRGYYIPVVLASFWFEILGGVVTAAGLGLLYLVHIWRDWGHHPTYVFQQYAEILMYLVVAVLLGYLARAQRKTRERLEQAGSDLEEAYGKLNRAFEQLRHSDRLASLGRLSAGIAHEIRNPLGSIQGAVEILGQDIPDTDPRSEFARIARQEVARLEKLTGEILAFSRPAPPRRMPADWREIAESAAHLCADEARRRGVGVVGRFDAPPATIHVDPEQVKQVLINILINAIQAQPDGGEVRICGAIEGDALVMAVEDDGPGIDPETIGSIFDPFFTTKREGTGLGLSISYQLVLNNGGEIRVESGRATGACLRVVFPIDRERP